MNSQLRIPQEVNVYLNAFILISAFSVFFVFSFVRVLAQDINEVTVNKLQAETSNGLLIRVWTDKREVRFSEDLIVRFSITNSEKKPVFVVKKGTPEVAYDRGDVLIQAPVPLPEDVAEYDYSFHQLKPGQTYQGEYLISRELFQKDYDLNIRLGLGVVDDITGLDQKLKPADDPMSLRGPLRRRMRVFVLGELRVIVVRR